MKWILLFLALLNLDALALTRGQPDSWIGIDCGSNRSTATNGILWQTDDAFINTGTNHPIPTDAVTALAILNTLRAFTDQNKNCYTLPASPENRYFIRAVFFYANYDGRSDPPSFDLQIDGNKIATVDTSSTEVRYHEILYRSQRSNISVCLARTQSGRFPFVSSLEAWPISYDMYTGMNEDLAWIKSYRYDYGSPTGIIGYPSDYYNRIWEPMSVPGTVNTTADPGNTIYSCGEYPPQTAMLDAIEAENNATSLFLPFGPLRTTTPIFVEAYFAEMSYTNTRSFDMYIDGQAVSGIGPITPSVYSCTAEPVLVQVSTSNFTIELRSTDNSPLPPIINAIEVYSASDPLVMTGTDQNDLKGLEALTSTFDQLKGWNGEPCLPADSVWQWLGCAGSDPPRVLSLNLSGYNLNGALPIFSQMQALEDIDLSKNRLSGKIPGFLGQLPNLKKLNLSFNDFSGPLPSSILNNRRLKYDINGNPNVDASGKDESSRATVIGLAVGIPSLLIITILALAYWLIRKRANQGQNQGTGPETGDGNMHGHENPGQEVQTPHYSAPMEATAEENEDCVPVDTIDCEPNKQSMVPEMDLDELEELIDKYAKGRRREDNQAEVDTDEDCMVVAEYGVAANDDQSMVPDMDLEELDEIIQQRQHRPVN